MDKLVIIGAGPHAKVIVDIFLQNQEYEIEGLVDKKGTEGFLGLSVIGDDDCLADLYQSGVSKAFIAIGDNAVRQRLYMQVKKIGFAIVNAVSRAAVISPRASVGEGVAVMPGAVINVDTVIGNGCIINTNASVDHDGKMGDFVHVAPGTAIAGSVCVGEATFCGCGCRVIDGLTIGHHVTIGAGAVVIRDVVSNSKVVGVPAHYI
jgi:UDP-perosamine 4-acetyltransferase